MGSKGISGQRILEDCGLLTLVLRSAVGYKQTLAGLKTTSTLPPGADLLDVVSKGLLLTQAV